MNERKEQFERTKLLIGEEGMRRLAEARVAVFGIGGVGGFAAEALARSGVGSLELIDSDRVEPTNLNRQIVALHSTIGRYKTEVMRDRILDINPDAKVTVRNCFYLPETASEFDFSSYDYVVDAVDTVTAKLDIILSAKRAGVPVISSMGAGNKLDPSLFRVADIYKTSVCPLAKVMRRELKARGVRSLKVVYSTEQPVTKRRTPGSIAFVPSVAGLMLAGEVVRDLAGGRTSVPKQDRGGITKSKELSMRRKAIFLDLDGTLLDDQKQITKENQDAINDALAAGHSVIIATGRPLSSARILAEELGLTGEGCYIISFNGGILYDFGADRVLYRRTLPLELVYAVFDEANRRGIHIQTYDEEHVLVEDRCDDEDVRMYCRIDRIGYRTMPSIRDLAEEPVKLLAIERSDLKKGAAFRDWIVREFEGVLDSYFSSGEFIEIVPAGLDKGQALLRMAELLEIPVEDTIAVGDEANDKMMLRTAGLGAAMANGTDEVKAEANYITRRDNNESGVAEVIRTFMLR
jgi:Cof subfamily protein (haloacid dehalogenase superfamily)